MNYQRAAAEIEETSGRLWRFADYEFDELRRELRVKGKATNLESKPLDILLQLLLHAGEVVTKEELLDSVWPDVMVVDGSLATAVSKLRKAMGDEDHPAIVTVPRVGYRLAVPAYCKTVASPGGPELGFKTGDLVPGNRLPICQRRSNTHHSLLISRLHASELAQRIALLADPDRDWHADAARRWPGNGCQNRR